ncbi:unnamed protein product [Cuscuta campestris]|uniref:Uncharacterized protein n=1 Tax=Cuscuta campestris TaxID=132261 RepID=A0A484MMI0_9ASTE|nr:unnamed protein product [Cuscuta campestris]
MGIQEVLLNTLSKFTLDGSIDCPVKTKPKRSIFLRFRPSPKGSFLQVLERRQDRRNMIFILKANKLHGQTSTTWAVLAEAMQGRQ